MDFRETERVETSDVATMELAKNDLTTVKLQEEIKTQEQLIQNLAKSSRTLSPPLFQ